MPRSRLVRRSTLGFYYDFDLGTDEDGKPLTFTPEDLEQIQKRMRQIIGGKHEFQLSRGQCRRGAQAFRTTSPTSWS